MTNADFLELTCKHIDLLKEVPLLGLHKKEQAKSSKQLGECWSEAVIAADLNWP